MPSWGGVLARRQRRLAAGHGGDRRVDREEWRGEDRSFKGGAVRESADILGWRELNGHHRSVRRARADSLK